MMIISIGVGFFLNASFATMLININMANMIMPFENVSVRLNVTKNNWEDMLSLLDQLFERFGNKIDVYPYPVFETSSNTDGVINKENISKYLGEIFEKLKQKGYREKICKFKDFISWHCTCTLPHNFVIMPSGKLLKCQSEVGQDLYLGDVFRGVMNKKRNDEYCQTELPEECIKCCYLPICQGGCLVSTKCASKIERCCLEKYYMHDLIEKYYLSELEE